VEFSLDRQKGSDLRRALPRRSWSLWRYRELLPVEHLEDRIDLGEGGTPLVSVPLFEKRESEAPRVWVKEESGNPTGSFKARGLSLAVNRARELGAAGVELPSAGNAALAVAAYAAAAGLPCRVAVPADTPRTIVERCQRYGADVIEVPGTLMEAGEELRRQNSGFWDLSTLKEPYRLEGKKTMGFELAEQFGWSLPEWILYPTGGGTGLIGMDKAFRELAELRLVGTGRPRFVAVQMKGCAPIVRAFESGADEAKRCERPDTRVWGLRVPKPTGDFLILEILRRSGGAALAVEEEEVALCQQRLAAERGLEWGPEGAACWVALHRLVAEGQIGPSERVVVFQTGHPGNYR
jgi:threonine synthase